MKDFEYCAPSTLREAVALKAEKGNAARVLAGGTDLIVQMRGKRFAPDRVIDIKNIADANELSYSPRKGLIIGAGVPCWRVYNDAEIAGLYPGLIDSAAIIGGIQIQGRATFGGNLCNSSPSADSAPSLITHSAVCNLIGPNGKRKVPVVDFCTGPGRNVLEPGEILVSLQVPGIKKNTGAHYQRFIPRNEMDIAVVGVSSHVVLAFFVTSPSPHAVHVPFVPASLHVSILGTRLITLSTFAAPCRPTERCCIGPPAIDRPSPMIITAKMVMRIVAPLKPHP